MLWTLCSEFLALCCAFRSALWGLGWAGLRAADLGLWDMGRALPYTGCCSDLSPLPPALGLDSLYNMELLTLGQLLTCPLLDFADRINQVGPSREKDLVQTQDLFAKL